MQSDQLFDLRDSLISELVRQADSLGNIVVLDVGLAGLTKTAKFSSWHQDRYFNLGLSEQDAVATAAGLALRGKIPLVFGLASFLTSRAFEQLRTLVSLSNLNVKIIGVQAGLSAGVEGPIYQSINDLALTRSLPNMKVFCPADANDCRQIINWSVNDFGPTYVRVEGGLKTAILPDTYIFKVGQGCLLKEGKEGIIFTSGSLIPEVLAAVNDLEQQSLNLSVVVLNSLKPIDIVWLKNIVKDVPWVMTVEDHSLIGGLGSALAEIIAEVCPKPVYRFGLDDRFGESGSSLELYLRYGLDRRGLKEKILKIVQR